jgi:hypothetical protein
VWQLGMSARRLGWSWQGPRQGDLWAVPGGAPFAVQLHSPSVCQQTILSFCLVADKRRLYGFRHDRKTFFVIMDREGERPGPGRRTVPGSDRSEEAYHG